MKNQWALVVLIFVLGGCSTNPNVQFEITETFSKLNFNEVKEDILQQKDSLFYEDEDYSVRSSCSGEWGGSIWFTNKKTGIEYASFATCPVVVNKLGSKYIVTTTLAHLGSFLQVFEIQDPELMGVFELPELIDVKGDTIPIYPGDHESHSFEGSVVLADGRGILILSSFPYQNELYHITTDYENTYVSVIENGQFVSVDTVSNMSISAYGPEVIITDDGHYITLFDNEEMKGYIDIKDNKIELKLFE